MAVLSDHDALTDGPDVARVRGLLMVRRMGSQTVHLADDTHHELVRTRWIGPTYWALHEPATAACGAVLRPDHRGLVVMQAGTTIGCRYCQRIALIDGSMCAEPLAEVVKEERP